MAESSWGFRITASTALLSVVSFAVGITTPPRSGPFCRGDCIAPPYTAAAQFVPRDYLWMYPATLLAVGTLVLFGFLHEQRVPTARRWLSGVGRSLAVVAVTALLFAYGLQLFVLQPGLLTGSTEGLSAWSQYNPSGIFIGLENLGYATMALAFVFVGMALSGDGSELVRASSRTLVAGGTATLVLLVVLAAVYRSDLAYRFEVWSLLINWLVLAVTGVLLSLHFRRARPRDGHRPRIAGEIEIARPPEVVFDLVADERNEPRFNPRLTGVEKLTPGPVGLGTQFRAETSTGGRTSAMTIEYTGFERPHLLASTTRMDAMDIAGTLTFQPTPRGTLLSWSWRVDPHGPLALLGPVVVRLGRRQERAIWSGLKHLLETE